VIKLFAKKVRYTCARDHFGVSHLVFL
jgi:hypothetical protein